MHDKKFEKILEAMNGEELIGYVLWAHRNDMDYKCEFALRTYQVEQKTKFFYESVGIHFDNILGTGTRAVRNGMVRATTRYQRMKHHDWGSRSKNDHLRQNSSLKPWNHGHSEVRSGTRFLRRFYTRRERRPSRN